jgi:hypothetical protein
MFLECSLISFARRSVSSASRHILASLRNILAQFKPNDFRKRRTVLLANELGATVEMVIVISEAGNVTIIVHMFRKGIF